MVAGPDTRHNTSTTSTSEQTAVKNKRIWLIGGGSGIGRELALKLALSGNKVVVSGRTSESLADVESTFQQSAGSADSAGSVVPLVYDVTDDQASASVAQQVAGLVGGIDILIYCAGRCEYVDDAELSVDLFRRVYEVNVFGMVNALSAALPLMKMAAGSNADKPQVVGVASLSAVVGLPRAEAYGSSKAAAIYMLDSLRLGLDRHQVDVTVVNPGFVDTPMTAVNDFPMPFIMQVDETADRIIAGIEKRKLTVNFPWQLLLSLKIGAWFPALWFGVIGPRLARRDAKNS